MAILGKCLLFYLKYSAEMKQLYQAESPNLKGVPNAKQVMEKVQLVGDAASREVAKFLESCVPGIEQHFRSIGVIRRLRTNLAETWHQEFLVSAPRTKNRRFRVGVCLEVDPPSWVPYVWSRGRRPAGDAIIRILGRKGEHAGGADWTPGSVTLPRIEIQLDQPAEFDALVSQVVRAFKPLTAARVKAICGIYRYPSPS